MLVTERDEKRGHCRESLHEEKQHGGGSQNMGLICTGHTLGKKVFDLIVE